MDMRNRSLAVLAALIGTQLACAHANERKPPDVADKVLVTGSHIPLRVDPKRGMPVTISGQIYSHDQLVGTGRADLGAALLNLDPSVTIGP
ncbi:MAG TPA: hypothetical protein VKB92_00085 [Myxococcales bacterium]|nr:hypothetical protein [Myxococcales bacterium]